MGSSDDHLKKQPQTRSKLKILLLLISTNILSVYLFSDHKYSPINNSLQYSTSLNSTQNELAHALAKVSDLNRRLSTSNSLLETLLSELGRVHGEGSKSNDLGGWQDELDGELKLAVGPHKLPFGYTNNIGSDELYPTLGSSCRNFQEDLVQYMNYEVGGECPSDDRFAQRLLLKGCEPLPRRRCHPKSPINFEGPVPFPESLWSIPPDTSIIWDPYTCKNYTCLVNRSKIDKRSYDCKDCFDLAGREKSRWMSERTSLQYSIDAVLSTKPPGTIRIGLDIGGGSGTFAARMRERNITIITTSMNFDGPFNSFISSRGLLSMHMSVAHRLPFFENTLDVVHSMHVLSNWIPDMVLEFALFDIYRVLRPGGLFWLDHFFCFGKQLNETYVPMFGRIGFNKLRWNAGRKLDKGIEKDEWYLSALLEKPLT